MTAPVNRVRPIYSLIVEAAGERTAVLESAGRAEVHLIRDAMQMAAR
jgi:hypothetical protein